VQRRRVVDAGADARSPEFREHAVAFGDLYDVEMPDVLVALARGGQAHAGQVGQHLGVAGGGGAACGVPPVEAAQLCPEHGGLHRVEARVHACPVVHVLDRAAVCAEVPNVLRDVRVVGEHGAGIARGSEVLARVEARRGDPADRAGPADGRRRALRLRGVFNDHQPVPLRNRGERLHRCGLAVEVNGDDRPGARGDGGLDGGRVDEQELVVDVDENRDGADPGRGLGRRDERVDGNDDLVAGADADGPQGEFDGVGAVGHSNAVLNADVLRVLPLE